MGPSLELEGSSGTEGAIPALPSLTVGPCISPGLGPGTQARCGPALPCGPVAGSQQTAAGAARKPARGPAGTHSPSGKAGGAASCGDR